MTSKNSFFLNLKENLKRRGAVCAVFALSFFFLYPVSCALIISSRNDYYDPAYAAQVLYDDLYGWVGPNEFTIFVAAVLAILCAVQGFSYLQHRQKVDLYHALPISRKRRFFLIYINGVLLYSVLYILALLCTIILCAGMGHMPDFPMLEHMALGFLLNLLSYLCVYHISIVAVMLTGKTVMTCFAIPILLFYETICRMLFDGYKSVYFTTVYQMERDYSGFTSPLVNMMTIVQSNAPQNKHLLWILGYLVLSLALALFLYLKRPAESSGSTLAFPQSRFFIKLFLLLPFALGFSMLFTMISSGTGWAGLFLGILLGHSIIEVLFDFDLRSIVHHKRQFLICFVTSTAIFSIFALDLFGYDRYLPAKDQLKSAAILPYFDTSYHQFYAYKENTYIDFNDYPLEQMQLTDTDAILTLVQSAIEQKKEGVYTDAVNFVCRYTLKSGKTVYRSYYIEYDTLEELFHELYLTPEYKNSILQLNNDAFLSFLKDCRLSFSYHRDEFSFPIDVTDYDELFALYRQDFATLTLDQSYKKLPCGMLSVTATLDETASANYSRRNYIRDSNFYFPLYDTFTNTLRWLEAHDIGPFYMPDVTTILYATIEGSLPSDDEEGHSYYSAVITNQQELAQLLEVIQPTHQKLGYYFHLHENTDYYYSDFTVRLQYYNSTNSSDGFYYFISKEAIPEFVKKALKES